MKTLSQLAIISLLTFTSVYAQDKMGDKGGNGGYSYVCRDSSGEIVSARLLDLWEPETYKTFEDDQTPFEDQITSALEKVKAFYPAGAKALKEQIAKEEAMKYFTNRKLPFTEDALPRYAPEPGCNYEQAARHGYNLEQDREVLEINRQIYEAFSNSDKAALWMHEALYTRARATAPQTLEVKNSDKVRLIIGKLFSSEDLSEKEKLQAVTYIKVENTLLKRENSQFSLFVQIIGAGAQALRKAGVKGTRGEEVVCKIGLRSQSKSLAGLTVSHKLRGYDYYGDYSSTAVKRPENLDDLKVDVTCSRLKGQNISGAASVRINISDVNNGSPFFTQISLPRGTTEASASIPLAIVNM